MPVENKVVTLTGTAQLIVGSDNMKQEIHLHNMTKSSNEYIHLGDENATITNSIHMDPGESKVINLYAGDELYALSDPAGLELGILRITQD